MASITIVGGGIAGLALAATLDPRHQVTVQEQAPGRRTAGTVLGMWPDVMTALDRIGAGDAVRAVSVPLGSVAITDASGRRITRRVQDPPGYGIQRPALLEVLSGLVRPEVAQVSGKVTVPDPGATDVLVGADGVHSVVRRALFPGRTASVRAGQFALRGVADGVVADDFVEVWRDGRLFGSCLTSSGDTNWYLSGRTTPETGGLETWSDEQTRAAAVAMAQPFGPRAVAAVTSTREVLHQQVWTVPGRRRYVHRNAALIGDAAHAMCPNLGGVPASRFSTPSRSGRRSTGSPSGRRSARTNASASLLVSAPGQRRAW
mgnify:CR=1 FL=1